MSTQSFWIGRPNQYMSDADFRTWVTRNWPKQLSTEFLIRTGTFTDNSPGAGSVAWSGVVVEYGNAQYRVTDGNTANTYLYWETTNTGAFTGTNTIPDLSDTLKLVGTNISGAWSRGADDTYKRVLTALTALGTINPGKVADSVAFAAGVVDKVAIAEEAVKLKHLGVKPESICPDPYFNDPEWWASNRWDANGWRVANAGEYSNIADSLGVMRCILLWSYLEPSIGTSAKVVMSPFIPLSGVGQWMRLHARVGNNCNQTIRVYAEFKKNDGTSYVAILDSTTGTGMQTLETQIELQAGTSEVQFVAYNIPDGSTFNGWGAVSEIKLDVAANKYLLEDDCVIGSKVLAGEIVASKCTFLNVSSLTADLGSMTSGTVTGATVQTSASANTGIKLIGSTLTGYASGYTSFRLDEYGLNSAHVRSLIYSGLDASRMITGYSDYDIGGSLWWTGIAIEASGTVRFVVDTYATRIPTGNLEISGGGLVIGARPDYSNSYVDQRKQVVGARQAAVADADSSTIVTQFNALLARLRTHGLIAT